jgi:hypothetical protein
MSKIGVLVPHEQGLVALADVPGVAAERYDVDGKLPALAATAQVFVPPFLNTREVVAITERLPELRLVQLLTAGAESWVGKLPAGVALADCRGAHGGTRRTSSPASGCSSSARGTRRSTRSGGWSPSA